MKIWLHGYFDRIRATRQLKAAGREHLSPVWLTGLIAPDHHSLWRFWRDNKKALRAVFKQSVQLVLQALAGPKIPAATTTTRSNRKPAA